MKTPAAPETETALARKLARCSQAGVLLIIAMFLMLIYIQSQANPSWLLVIALLPLAIAAVALATIRNRIAFRLRALRKGNDSNKSGDGG